MNRNKIYSLFCLNGDNSGTVIPLIHKDSSYVFEGKAELLFDDDIRNYIVKNGVFTINGKEKKDHMLETGNILSVDGKNYRYEVEDPDRLINFEKMWYSSVFKTGSNCINKYAFKYLFNLELSRSSRYKRPFSLIYLNFFNIGKDFSDIKGVQMILDENIRETDLCTDYSDNELLILLPETRKEDAESVRDKLVSEIKRMYSEMDILSNYVGFYEEYPFDNVSQIIASCINSENN